MRSASHAAALPVAEYEFTIATEERSGCRILTLSGDLDEVAAPELDGAIAAEADTSRLVVDLSGLTFIASAGIHVLLRERGGGAPAVVCPPGHVARVLEIVEATGRMRLFEDVGSALDAIAASRTRTRGGIRGGRRGPSIWRSRSGEQRPAAQA